MIIKKFCKINLEKLEISKLYNYIYMFFKFNQYLYNKY